jgi:hypothetical protein
MPLSEREEVRNIGYTHFHLNEWIRLNSATTFRSEAGQALLVLDHGMAYWGGEMPKTIQDF